MTENEYQNRYNTKVQHFKPGKDNIYKLFLS